MSTPDTPRYVTSLNLSAWRRHFTTRETNLWRIRAEQAEREVHSLRSMLADSTAREAALLQELERLDLPYSGEAS